MLQKFILIRTFFLWVDKYVIKTGSFSSVSAIRPGIRFWKINSKNYESQEGFLNYTGIRSRPSRFQNRCSPMIQINSSGIKIMLISFLHHLDSQLKFYEISTFYCFPEIFYVEIRVSTRDFHRFVPK